MQDEMRDREGKGEDREGGREEVKGRIKKREKGG